MSDLFGMAGQPLLDRVNPANAYRIPVESLRDLIEHLDRPLIEPSGGAAKPLHVAVRTKI